MVSNLAYTSPLGKSDHACITFDINCFREVQDYTNTIFLYDKGNYVDMSRELNGIDWQHVFDNLPTPDDYLEAFMNK